MQHAAISLSSSHSRPSCVCIIYIFILQQNMNKQYVGRDFSKGQATDKLSPENVRKCSLFLLLQPTTFLVAEPHAHSPHSLSFSSLASHGPLSSVVILCFAATPTPLSDLSVCLSSPTPPAAGLGGQIDTAAENSMPLCMKV